VPHEYLYIKVALQLNEIVLSCTIPLTHIYNVSTILYFSRQLKLARMKLLHKKGDKSDIQNYRPISLFVFPKILEKFIYISFVARDNILTEAQNGLTEKRSTETVMHAFLENIQESIDKKANPIGIFFYLNKAYAVISHEMLLTKLSSYGVRDIANLWFESYIESKLLS
jgi:hypothetical protein